MTRREWAASWQNRLSPTMLRRILEGSESLSPAGVLAHFDEPLIGPAEAWATRVEAGEPLDYVRGYAYFNDRRYRVSSDTLIPREDTMALLETALRLPGTRVLDIGAGSGILAGEIARAQPARTVVALDISPAAMRIARANLPETVSTVCGDLCAPFRDDVFDLIVSNPPYVEDDYPLPPEMDYEPRLALRAGPDGMAIYRRLATEAPRVLSSVGWLAIEIGAWQAERVAAVFSAHAEWRPMRAMASTGPENHLRVVAFQKSGI